jgi:DNA-binding response OmpR family regulator
MARAGALVLGPGFRGHVTKPSKRILVVEDDVAIAELLSKTLGRFYVVELVHDGGQALKRAESFKPDVVLLDVNLPNADGFSIAQSLKGAPALAKVPIIFLTAQDRSLDVVRGIQAGAKHYITKPFKLEEVLAKLKRLLPP